MPESAPRLSVIIPAYNEELRLPATLESIGSYLWSQSYGAEVIVVDDGSSDRTAEIARTCLSAKPLRLVQHPDGANHGKGAAVRLGMLAAAGQFRLFMDADNSTTLDQVAGLWPWFDKGYEVVIGSRRKQGARIDSRQSRHKELAGRMGNLVIRYFAVPGIEDTQAGFKMFTADCAKALFSRQTLDRWGYDIELLAMARQLGYRIREVPIIWNNAPGSKVRFGSYIEVLKEVWHVRRNLKSGRYLHPR